MDDLLECIERHASTSPSRIAIVDDSGGLTYPELCDAVARAASVIDGRRVAVMVENGAAWAVVDLALARIEAVSIPVPAFFTDAQVRHLLSDADPDLVITDSPERMSTLLEGPADAAMYVVDRHLALFTVRGGASRAVPARTSKVTYTSGTTGQPKGVCLSAAAIMSAVRGLAEAAEAGQSDRSLAVLPLTTLLQNIAGVYVPLYVGSTAVLPSLAECGIAGSSGLAPKALLAALCRYAPTAVVLVPQLLKAIVELVAAGAPVPRSLRFVAVGGAATGKTLVARAWALGLPVHEGYGLSEAASVVALNRPGDNVPGSTGRPLPDVQVRLAADGEVLVRGRLFLGYLGATEPVGDEWATGDLGELDAAGRLTIVGRKKNAYATAFGRNVAPEWVESQLVSESSILQAAVFGEGQTRNVAVLVPHPGARDADLASAVAAGNARLPDYARVAAWCRAGAPFSMSNGLADTSGAPRRSSIAHQYAAAIQRLHRSTDLAIDVRTASLHQ